MGFLDTLRQAVRGPHSGRSRGSVERLNLKVMRAYEEGRFREATEAARQLVELQREELGADHPDYATAQSNLALLLQRQGDLEGAEPMLRQVLATRKKALGESHPDYATSLNNLGELLSLREALAEAEPLLRQALAVRKDVLGESHPDYAVSLSSLALLLNKRGDYDGAETLMTRALEIRREMLGEFHPDYAAGLSNLASLFIERGELTRAEPLLRQALDIRIAALGDDHPDARATSSHLTRLLRRRTEIPRSEALSVRIPLRDEETPAQAPDRDGDIAVVYEPPPETEDGAADLASSAQEHADLSDLFKDVGERLRVAGEAMRSDGRFPDAEVLRALAVCHYRLSALATDVRTLAKSMGVPTPAGDQVDSLRDVETLLNAMNDVGAEKSRDQAVAMLKQVLQLQSRDPDDQSVLASCQDRARELQRIINASPTFEPPPVVEQLVQGDHPFACLLTLVADGQSADDERRASLRRSVAWAFGKPLAESAVEGRLVLATNS